MSDPQTSMCTVLKPPKGFETWMQGVALTTPIPMVPVHGDEAKITDTISSTEGLRWDPLMLQYLPVPLGSTVLIWFPRIIFEDTGPGNTLIETPYRYQLKWRLRSIQDMAASKRQKTYSLLGSLGANTALAPNTLQQFAVPAAIGDVIVPALPTNNNTVLFPNSSGQLMADSQGFYGQALFLVNPAVPRSVLFYPPVLVPALGDELSIYAYRPSGAEDTTWEFNAPGNDTGFSAFYGVGTGTYQHPWYPSHGIYVATQGRATFP